MKNKKIIYGLLLGGIAYLIFRLKAKKTQNISDTDKKETVSDKVDKIVKGVKDAVKPNKDNITYKLAIKTNGVTARDSSVFIRNNVNFLWKDSDMTQDVKTGGTWRFYYKKQGDSFSNTRFIEQTNIGWLTSKIVVSNLYQPVNIFGKTLTPSNAEKIRSYFGVPTGTVKIPKGNITCYKLK